MFLQPLLILALIASAFGQHTDTDIHSVQKVTIVKELQPGDDSTKTVIIIDTAVRSLHRIIYFLFIRTLVEGNH